MPRSALGARVAHGPDGSRAGGCRRMATKVFITGAGGYLGSAIAARLVRAVHASFARDGQPAALDQGALEAFRDAAEDGRLRRLLYTSSVWVHGDPESG